MNDCSSDKALNLDALIICFNRQSEVEVAIDSCNKHPLHNIWVLDNASEVPIVVQPHVQLIRSASNLGPCNGRNALAQKTSSELLLFLDDDAVLNPDSDIQGLIEEFVLDEDLSVIAGLVKRENGEIAKLEFPARTVSKVSTQREVGYFVEGFCIIRRRDFEGLGGYDGNFFYGHEGSDFSLRLAASGKKIVYDPRLSFVHRPSLMGRSLTTEKYARLLRNRRILSWRNLPRPIAFLHTTIWFAYYTAHIWKKGPAEFMQLIKAAVLPITALERTIKRSPLPFNQLNRLQKIGYRIYW